MDAPDFDEYMFQQAAAKKCNLDKSVKQIGHEAINTNILEKASRSRQKILQFAYFGAAITIQRRWRDIKVMRDLKYVRKHSKSCARWIQIFIDAKVAADARKERTLTM
tara:strand:- start:1481 stop:1804 length:324 start_codon:yes stop_codon:yes gene_type:complete